MHYEPHRFFSDKDGDRIWAHRLALSVPVGLNLSIPLKKGVLNFAYNELDLRTYLNQLSQISRDIDSSDFNFDSIFSREIVLGVNFWQNVPITVQIGYKWGQPFGTLTRKIKEQTYVRLPEESTNDRTIFLRISYGIPVFNLFTIKRYSLRRLIFV